MIYTDTYSNGKGDVYRDVWDTEAGTLNGNPVTDPAGLQRLEVIREVQATNARQELLNSYKADKSGNLQARLEALEDVVDALLEDR